MTYEESLHTIVLTYILLYMLVPKLKANNLPRKKLKPIQCHSHLWFLCTKLTRVQIASVYFFQSSIRSSPTGEVHILLAVRSGNPGHFVFVRVRLVGTHHYWLNLTRLSFKSHFKIMPKKNENGLYSVKIITRHVRIRTCI